MGSNRKLTVVNLSRKENLVAHIIRKFKRQTSVCITEFVGLLYVTSTHSSSLRNVFFCFGSVFSSVVSIWYRNWSLVVASSIFILISQLQRKRKYPFLNCLSKISRKYLIGTTLCIPDTITMAREQSMLTGQSGLCGHCYVRKAGEVIDSSSGFGTEIHQRKEEKEEE